MYTLHIANIDTVFCMGLVTARPVVVVLQMLISINVIVTIAGGGGSSERGSEELWS